MPRILLFLSILLFPLCEIYAQSVNNCSNIDLENADFSNWNGSIGCPARGFAMRKDATCPHTRNTIDPAAGVDGVTSQHEIISTAFNGGRDFNVAALSIASPLPNFPSGALGQYVARIGNYQAAPVGVGGTGAAQSAELTYDILVDSSNLIIQIAYAIVLESPGGHAVNELPYFSINVLDPNGNKIPCMQYEVVGNTGVPGFKSSGGYVYRDWTIASLYLGNYYNQTITVQVQTSDCYLEAHAGWAYVDATCDSLKINATKDTICYGEFTELAAPEGMESYKWYYLSDSVYSSNPTYYDGIAAGNFGGAGAIDTMKVFTEVPTGGGAPITGRRVTYNRPGHYFVELTPFSTSGVKCPFRMRKQIFSRPMPNPGFTFKEPLCQGVPVNLSDTSLFYNSHISKTYTNSIPDPNPNNWSYDTSLVTKRYWTWDPQVSGGEVIITKDTVFAEGDSLFYFVDNEVFIDSVTHTNNPNLTDTSGIITIGLRHINDYGCTKVFYQEIEIRPIDTIVFTDPGVICTNEPPVQLEAEAKDGSWDGDSQTWYGTGVSSSGQFDPSTYAGSPGSYWVYLRQEPCGETDSMLVTVADPVDPEFSAPEYVCPGASPRQLIAVTPGGTFSGKHVSSSGWYDPSNAPAGNDTIWYHVGVNCKDSSMKMVNVIRHEPFQFQHPGSQCLKDIDIQLIMFPTGGSWQGNGIVNSSAGLWNPNAAGLGTHYLTYTTTGDCPNDTVIEIEVIDNPDAGFIAPDTVCNDDGLITFTVNQNGGLWSGPGIADPSKAEFNPANVLPNQSHRVFYEFGGSCAVKDSADIYVGFRPEPVIDPAGPFCDADTVYSLSANISGGTWSGPGIVDVNFGKLNPSQAGVGTHTITLDIPGVCPNSTTLDIEITDKVLVSITAPKTYYCDSEAPVQFTGTPSGGIWQGSGMASDGTFDPAAAGPGNHIIIYRIPGICGGSDTINIDVDQFRTANLAPIDALCDNGSPQLILCSPAGGTLSGAGITVNAGDTVFDPTMVAPGSHNITYAFAGQCAKDSTITVQVIDLPTLDNASPYHVSCNGLSDGALKVSSTDGLGPHSYAYNPAPSFGNGTDTASGFPAGIVTITVTDSIGCQSTATANITEPPALSFVLNSVDENCGSGDGSISSSNISGGTAPYTYTWNNAATTPNLSAVSAGTYTLTITDANNCQLSKSVTISSSPAPLFTLNEKVISCNSYDDAELYITNVSNVIRPITNYLNGTQIPDTNALNLAPGSYSWRIEDQVGCSRTHTINISEPQPLLTAIPYEQDTICINDTRSITAAISGGNPGGYNPVWLDSKDNVVSNSLTLTYNLPDDYRFYANDNVGCPSDTMYLEVAQRDFLQLSAQAVPNTLCPGDTTHLIANGSGGNGNFTYTWHDSTGAQIGSGAEYWLQMNSSNGAVQIITAEINDGCAPPEQVQIPINFYPNPRPQLAPEAACEPFVAPLVDTSGTANAWRWEVYRIGENPKSYSGNNVNTAALPEGDYIVDLWTENSYGCKSFTQFTNRLTAYPMPEAHIKWNPTHPDVNSGMVNIYNYNNLHVTQQQWSITDIQTLASLYPTTKNVAYPITGSDSTSLDVRLTVQTDFGCVDSAYARIKIDLNTDIYIPNTFSPNNDGTNEIFKPITFNISEKGYALMIFNRWGEQLYKTVDLESGWNGEYLGEKVPPGVYVWRITYLDHHGEAKSLMGHVNVLR